MEYIITRTVILKGYDTGAVGTKSYFTQYGNRFGSIGAIQEGLYKIKTYATRGAAEGALKRIGKGFDGNGNALHSYETATLVNFGEEVKAYVSAQAVKVAEDQAKIDAAPFHAGDKIIYRYGGTDGAGVVISADLGMSGNVLYVVEGGFGYLTGVRERDLTAAPVPAPDAPAPVQPAGDMEAAAAAVNAARNKGYDVYFGTMDYARVAASHGVSADALHDYMVWHLAPAYVPLGEAPAPDPSFTMRSFICQLCGRGFQAAQDVDNADVTACLSCGSDMVQDVTPAVDTAFFLEHDAVNVKAEKPVNATAAFYVSLAPGTCIRDLEAAYSAVLFPRITGHEWFAELRKAVAGSIKRGRGASAESRADAERMIADHDARPTHYLTHIEYNAKSALAVRIAKLQYEIMRGAGIPRFVPTPGRTSFRSDIISWETIRKDGLPAVTK